MELSHAGQFCGGCGRQFGLLDSFCIGCGGQKPSECKHDPLSTPVATRHPVVDCKVNVTVAGGLMSMHYKPHHDQTHEAKMVAIWKRVLNPTADDLREFASHYPERTPDKMLNIHFRSAHRAMYLELMAWLFRPDGVCPNNLSRGIVTKLPIWTVVQKALVLLLGEAWASRVEKACLSRLRNKNRVAVKKKVKKSRVRQPVSGIDQAAVLRAITMATSSLQTPSSGGGLTMAQMEENVRLGNMEANISRFVNDGLAKGGDAKSQDEFFEVYSQLSLSDVSRIVFYCCVLVSSI